MAFSKITLVSSVLVYSLFLLVLAPVIDKVFSFTLSFVLALCRLKHFTLSSSLYGIFRLESDLYDMLNEVFRRKICSRSKYFTEAFLCYLMKILVSESTLLKKMMTSMREF